MNLLLRVVVNAAALAAAAGLLDGIRLTNRDDKLDLADGYATAAGATEIAERLRSFIPELG